ncbi:MAG: SsrA-binding protein SmpB [Mycoplasmataceae bacterium]|nr:SsrA-binding protein SmpB [Mycoplasmataceae bacterium]
MKVIVKNKRGLHNYVIEKKYEAGISLLGSEVKSIRNSDVIFSNSSYIFIEKGEVYLSGLEIKEYASANILNHDPKRVKKLLLNSKEIKRISEYVNVKGLTVVPVMIYFNSKSLIKVEIAVARGVKKYDKREKEKEKNFKKGLL